ncbi:MAG: FAD:protein FMN transferase [Oscillospiraceae bacterium]|nr:FAD:protein FMN transferase [Oscillospiraceae bacterium]
MKAKKTLALSLVFLMILIGFCSCTKDEEPISSQQFVMDTVLTQKLYSSKDASDEVYEALSELENRLSAFKEGSEIYKINNADGKSTTLSKDTFELVEKSAAFAKESEYLFDISVYPLSRLWKSAIENGKLPEKNEVLSAKSLVGTQKITLDKENLSITLQKGMGLDLGAVAKGAALEKVRKIYEQKGVSGAICSLGNSAMLLFGNKAGEDFKIGLKNPLENADGKLFATLLLSDCIVSTSGGYERFVEIEGKKYHHIIDTKTGYPAENNIASVTVVGSDGAFCDYMSTRLFLEGFENSVKLIEQNEIAAVVVTNDKKVYVSKSLEEKIEITDSSFERINIK